MKRTILEVEKTRCQRCCNYQPYEPEAGLHEGCTADEYMQDGDKMLDFVSNCTSITFMLENLDVISFRDSVLLRNIIDREYEKMLERKYK